MDPIEIASSKVSHGCRGGDLAVEGIARLDLDPLRDFDNRRNRLVPAIVPLAGLVGEAFAVIDRDAFHSSLPGTAEPRLCARPVGGKRGSKDRNGGPRPAVLPRKLSRRAEET